MSNIPTDFDLASYDFELPEARIAQHPAARRDGSRLMLLDRKTGTVRHAAFKELADHLPENALLVANNSKVLPARVFGKRPTGGKVEFLLLSPLPLVVRAAEREETGWCEAEAEGLLRASKPMRLGDEVLFSDDFFLVVEDTGDFGRCSVRISWRGWPEDLEDHFRALGHLPLPPYIRRPDDAADAERYQTTYANPDKIGSVAAPTAGLHFTPELRAGLAERGMEWAEVTLYVGYGTFSPIRCRDLREHAMHKECIEITPETAAAVNRARAEGRPVIGVGTTAVRTLEGAALAQGLPGKSAATGPLPDLAPFQGWTDIFIAPGYDFRVADGMSTNFHLPESSLVVMVSAMAGRETILSAYAEAIRSEYRFFSYGDAMLIS